MSKRAMDQSQRPMARLLREGYEARCEREGRRILMKQIAEELGINPDQISRYLSGTTVPYKDTEYFLEDLARVFQVPFEAVKDAARERPKKGVRYTDSGEYVQIVKNNRARTA